MLKIIKKYKYPYLFILPFFILFFVFQLLPTIWTFIISLTKWNGIGVPQFIGTKNYKLMLRDVAFWDAMKNTFVYWITSVVIILVLSIILASLLNSKYVKIKTFFKTVSFLPYVSATIAMGLIFRMLFDENVGLINEIIMAFGGTAQSWLTSTSLSKTPVIILYVWRNTPWFTMIILSGLLHIPNEYYEAAKIDGASFINQFLKITLPCLNNIMFFCFITVTVEGWKMFNEPYILAGPGTSNTSLFQYMYESGFNVFQMGYASALGCVLIVILFIISIVQFVVRRCLGEI